VVRVGSIQFLFLFSSSTIDQLSFLIFKYHPHTLVTLQLTKTTSILPTLSTSKYQSQFTMASTSHSYDFYPSPSHPITMPSKDSTPLYPYGQTDYSRLSSSPPEGTDTASSGGPSYDPSAISGSYAASAGDYESILSEGVSSIDLLEFMNDRLQSSYDPLEMDKSLVQQTQT
jgi:hypothetical protein